MELIERTGFLTSLETKFENVAEGEGHCILVTGESGIGKTSLVKAFCTTVKNDCNIYQGTCDALFTPRPLAPLYDIALQIRNGLQINAGDISDRAGIFAKFFHELSVQKKPFVIVFEDIHWADEATLDFIKFLARRITRLKCFFILTYRDNEIPLHHPLRNVLGQFQAGTFTRVQLDPLSKEGVIKMAGEKGCNGEDVYTITGGNPFYVTEILANYSTGVPESIKDSVLSVYNRTAEKAKQVWDLLSVIPSGLEIKYLEKLESGYIAAIENCLQSQVLLVKGKFISFKHELFRRAIESALSPLKRISLNKRILEVLHESFEQDGNIERIIHHAKNANDHELVVEYAPRAAKEAAIVGAHTEAAKLYLSAIEYYQGKDKNILLEFYEGYAYECYLTNQIKEAIIYCNKCLELWKERNDAGKIGNCLRFLSRLWWQDGNPKNAESYARQAINVLNDQPSSPVKAMAFSNMSQLKKLLDQPAESLMWGEKAIVIAKELGDEESLSHALNNVGSVYMNMPVFYEKGLGLLEQSLEIALKNCFHEHAARSYSNMTGNALKLKNYPLAKKLLDDGIRYCDERDLDSSLAIKLALRSVYYLETSNWNEAYRITDDLLKTENHHHAFRIILLTVKGTIHMRRGDQDAYPFLAEAAAKAREIRELQHIIPTLIALLEYEWLTGRTIIKTEDLDRCMDMIGQSIYSVEKNEFAFWLLKTRKQHLILADVYEGYDVSSAKKAQIAAVHWKRTGNPYVQALTLFYGTEDDKREAIRIVHELGADAVYEKMKSEMRNAGIKSIPRGIRKSTKSNPAFLTHRELDVLALLHQGMQNKEIAGQLFISAKTVDNHISSILYKLEVNSRTKAVKEALLQEIIK